MQTKLALQLQNYKESLTVLDRQLVDERRNIEKLKALLEAKLKDTENLLTQREAAKAKAEVVEQEYERALSGLTLLEQSLQSLVECPEIVAQLKEATLALYDRFVLLPTNETLKIDLNNCNRPISRPIEIPDSESEAPKIDEKVMNIDAVSAIEETGNTRPIEVVTSERSEPGIEPRLATKEQKGSLILPHQKLAAAKSLDKALVPDKTDTNTEASLARETSSNSPSITKSNGVVPIVRKDEVLETLDIPIQSNTLVEGINVLIQTNGKLKKGAYDDCVGNGTKISGNGDESSSLQLVTQLVSRLLH